MSREADDKPLWNRRITLPGKRDICAARFEIGPPAHLVTKCGKTAGTRIYQYGKMAVSCPRCLEYREERPG